MCKTLVYISIAKGSGTTMAVSSFSKKDAINCVTLSSLSELDRAYSPSLWNNRGLSSEETIQRHVSTTLKESKKAAVELYSKINVQYGSTPKSVLDLYSSSPTVAPGAQLIVYVHGGYWQFLSKEESAFLALPICMGSPPGTAVIFLAVDYVLASEKQYGQQASMTGICQQMQQLFTFVGNLTQVLQCSGAHFIGHSAGAHLVATMLSQLATAQASPLLPLLQGIWLVSGVYDLEPISHTYVDEPLKLTAREIEDCSPINLVEALVKNLSRAPNTTLAVVFGQYDPPVFREQSEKYHREIKQKLKCRRGTSDDQAFKLAEPLEIPDRDHFTVVDQLHNSVLLKDIQRFILQEGRRTRTIGLKPQAMPCESINLNQIDYRSLVQS